MNVAAVFIYCVHTRVPSQPSSPPGSAAYINTFKEEWREVFLISAEMYVFGAIIYLILASGKKQWWADGVAGGCTTSCREQSRQEMKRKAASAYSRENTPAGE